MIACVGQQSVGGHRAPNEFIDHSLPHFPKCDRTPTAKGFAAISSKQLGMTQQRGLPEYWKLWMQY